MISPLEIATIAAIAIIFLMFSPKKIPELARSIGLARKEFNNASPVDSSPPSASIINTTAVPSAASTGDALIDTAKRLGIVTSGKSRQEISDEIVRRA